MNLLKTMLLLVPLLLLTGCAQDYRPVAIDGQGTPFSRNVLLCIASDAARDFGGSPDDNHIANVVEIIPVVNREDLAIAVLSYGYGSDFAVLVEIIGAGYVQKGLCFFTGGDYPADVSRVIQRAAKEGVYIKVEYCTRRGNDAGHDELVVRPDNSLRWIHREGNE